ncbi:MAG TPA: YXWGXW repeat-containing protein [Casimicrobiaceae bacterium]
MLMRKKILVAALALGAISVPIVSEARTVIVEVAPPPARVEVVPAARVGYVWAPGYWNWNGHRHVWVAGRWVGERHGWHWEPHHWEEREGRWHFHEGGWRR